MAQLRSVFVALLGVWLFLSTASAQQPVVGPQSLIGEWVGTWVGDSPQYRGDYTLTITKIEGDQIWGNSDYSGSGRMGRGAHEWQGKINGNSFTYTSTNGRVESEYVIAGDNMTGSAESPVGGSKMSLTSKK